MRYTPLNITTILILGLTLWTIIVRIRSRPDSNWPLFYYLFLVGYHQYRPGALNEYTIYIGVICTLLLRFEFMAGFFRWLFVGVEALMLGVISLVLLNLVITR